jgi:hypothetical protein
MMEPDEINEGHCYRLTASNGRKVIVRVERFSTSTIKIGREIAGTAGGDVEFETKNVCFVWRFETTIGLAKWSPMEISTLANLAWCAEGEVPCG